MANHEIGEPNATLNSEVLDFIEAVFHRMSPNCGYWVMGGCWAILAGLKEFEEHLREAAAARVEAHLRTFTALVGFCCDRGQHVESSRQTPVSGQVKHQADGFTAQLFSQRAFLARTGGRSILLDAAVESTVLHPHTFPLSLRGMGSNIPAHFPSFGDQRQT